MKQLAAGNSLLRGIVRHLVMTSAIFTGSMILIVSVQAEISVVDLANAIKFVSLVILLIVNGEIAHGIDRDQVDIKRINQVILVITFFIAVIQITKMFGLQADGELLASSFSVMLTNLQNLIVWISVAPIFMYAALDCYIAFFRKSNYREKMVAKSYVLFVDLPIIFPLLFIIFVAVGHIIFKGYDTPVDIFISGAVSVVIISSAIAAKIVDDIDDNLLSEILADKSEDA